MYHLVIEGICGEALSFTYSIPAILLSGFVWIIAGYDIYVNVKEKKVHLPAMGTAVATVGILGADDLFTTFICFEIAGLLSVFWIMDRTERNQNEVATLYLGWIIITAMIMTMGMFLVYHYTGTLTYGKLKADLNHPWFYTAGFCYLVGYGTRMGVAFFHGWIDSVLLQLRRKHAGPIFVMLLIGGIWPFYRIFEFLYGQTEWVPILIVLGVLTVISYVLSYRGLRNPEQTELEREFSWLSMEKIVYRPLFYHVLPFIFGVIFRVIDYLPDTIVAGLRGSVYQDSKQRVWDKVGTPFTYVLGVMFDEILHVMNLTILRRHPIQKSCVNGMAVARKEMDKTWKIVSLSVSFGLMLFAIGMTITMVYLFL